ncbi:elongation factor Tu GTP binding domain-containing protein, partial [Cardiosporidium cionae]
MLLRTIASFSAAFVVKPKIRASRQLLRPVSFPYLELFKSPLKSPAYNLQEAFSRRNRKSIFQSFHPRLDYSLFGSSNVEALPSPHSFTASSIRNLAIVAHVDHGKTTLVDALLAYPEHTTSKLNKRILDRGDQEKERGITIFSKNAAITYNGTKINIVDTPGHADFAGEVERVMNMVDSVLLVIDSVEGPKPQTRFVLQKALAAGHQVIVVVNKIDRSTSRPEYVVDKTFDLFVELNATEDQANFQTLYTSAIHGTSGWSVEVLESTMQPLLNAILQLPCPKKNSEIPLQMLITDTEVDEFKGRLGIGKLNAGRLRKQMDVGIARFGEPLRKGQINELYEFSNISRCEVKETEAGNIIIIGGISDIRIGDSIVDLNKPLPLPSPHIAEPTVKMTVGVNKSPLVGKDKLSKFLTFEQIKDRLYQELHKNVALRVTPSRGDQLLVSGRGQMHLTVLIEAMRREGFELLLGPPQVIEKLVDSVPHEPWDSFDVVLMEQYMGTVMQEIQLRYGKIEAIEPIHSHEEGYIRILFLLPTRNTIGLRSQ